MVELPKISTTELALGASALALGAGVATVAIVRSRRKKTRKQRRSKAKGSRKRVRRGKKLKFGSKAYRKKYLKHGRRKQKSPHTAGKRRDSSRRRIRYTKNNQPYVILSDGRARFISKKSVSSSRKRRGGRY